MNIDSLKDDKYKDIVQYNQSINVKLNDIIKPLLIKYQIKYFYYIRYFNNKVFFICTDLDYLTQVVETRLFAKASPVFLEEIAKLEPYSPRKFIWTGKPPDKVHEMLCDFDIWNGYTIYEMLSDGLEIWGFGTTQNNTNIINFYANESFMLKNFMLYFKDVQRDLLDVSQPGRLVPSNFYIPKKNIETACTIDDPYLDKIKRFYFTDKDYITRRELECVIGMVNFKSSKEIARDLGLSHRTVEKHLENVKSRFKQSTRGLLFKSILEMESINHLFFSDMINLGKENHDIKPQ